MTVIDLDSRRPRKPRYCCPRHALDALAERADDVLAEHTSLLIPADVLEVVIADIRRTTDELLPIASRGPRERQS